jgi:predicted Holliday junction resolvase-like endonuclease
LIGLTFSNTIVANVWTSEYTYRCKIEYIQLDLITGKETIYKNTTQFDSDKKEQCNEGYKKLAKKLVEWVKKRKTNIIANLNTVVSCKEKEEQVFFAEWYKYEECKEKYYQKVIDYIIEKHPVQMLHRMKLYENITTPIE